MTLDVARIRKDFPILDRQVRDGQPLVYLDSANTSQKPRQVIERDGRVLRAAQRQHPPGQAPARRGGHRGLRGRPGQGGRLHRRAGTRPRWCSPRTSPRRINLVAYALGNATLASRRLARFRLGPGDEIVITEMEHHSNIVPWQLLCAAHRRHAALVRRHRRRPARPVAARRADQRADQDRRARAPVQRARHHQPGRARSPTRAHAVGALVLVDAAQSVPHMPVDVQRAGRRLPGLHRAQDVRPDRHRRAVGPPRAARGDAAVPGRRRDDRDASGWTGSTFAPPPHKFEAGHHADRRGGRARRGRRLPHRRRHGRDPGARAGADRLRARRPGESAGPAVLGPTDAGGPRRRDLVHPRRRAPARRQPGARRAAASPSGPATTARGRCTAVRRPGGPGRRSTCTRRRTRSTRWSRASSRRRSSSDG